MDDQLSLMKYVEYFENAKELILSPYNTMNQEVGCNKYDEGALMRVLLYVDKLYDIFKKPLMSRHCEHNLVSYVLLALNLKLIEGIDFYINNGKVQVLFNGTPSLTELGEDFLNELKSR